MSLLDFLKNVFLIVFPFSLILTTALYAKKAFATEKDDVKSDNLPTEQKKIAVNKVHLFVLISALLLLIVGLILLWTKFFQYKWVFIILSLPVYLGYLTGALRSISILGNVIKVQSNDDLSPREQTAIQSIAYAIFYLGIFDLHTLFLNVIAQFPNYVVSDSMIALFYVAVSFTYIFFILALLPTPLFFCIKLLKKVGNRLAFREQMKRIGDFFADRIESTFSGRSILVYYCNYIKRTGYPTKALLYIFLPAVYIVDVGWQLLYLLFSILLSIIGYIVVLFRIIKGAIKKSLLWILSLSDKRIVAVSFRLALIAALVSVVALNRYQPIFKEYEQSTAVFEFLASSIIIPVVFEWIYSFREKRKG